MIDRLNQPHTLTRREFVKAASVVTCMSAASGLAQARPASSVTPVVGIQIAPHSFLDEGIDHCLDLLHDSAAINAPMLNCYSYYGAMGRPLDLMADHDVPKKDNARRELPMVWVRHHEKYYADTSLRHAQPDEGREYAGREIFNELAEPARQRGMKLYVRIYEPAGDTALRHIANWAKVRELGTDGAPLSRPCLNHPEFRAWTVATVRDLFENYPLDGIQYGAERCGPLGAMMRMGRPYCFCEHCLRRGREKGIDAERARQGMAMLYDYLDGLVKAATSPTDGAAVGFLRILMNYPEVLAWERQWHLANGEVHQLVYDAVKKIRPTADIGRHVAHVESSCELFFRAGAPYGEMASYCDFIKPILYHEIFGPRLRAWYLEPLSKTLLHGLPLEQSLDLFYALFGHDPARRPKFEALDEGFSPEYVYRETKRCADALQGQARVYSGIGLDIPKGGGWGTAVWQSDPDNVYQAVRRAFDAGAGGIVVSREYEEITVSSLKAVGRAVRDAAKARA